MILFSFSPFFSSAYCAQAKFFITYFLVNYLYQKNSFPLSQTSSGKTENVIVLFSRNKNKNKHLLSWINLRETKWLPNGKISDIWIREVGQIQNILPIRK